MSRSRLRALPRTMGILVVISLVNDAKARARASLAFGASGCWALLAAGLLAAMPLGRQRSA